MLAHSDMYTCTCAVVWLSRSNIITKSKMVSSLMYLVVDSLIWRDKLRRMLFESPQMHFRCLMNNSANLELTI